jgi:lambda repressor-like predicted transcriptional regulator
MGAVTTALSGNLRDALAVLAALVTPALLILASSGLAGSTTSHLADVIDRTKAALQAYRELTSAGGDSSSMAHQREALAAYIRRASRRSSVLQRALAAEYVAMAVFIATSAGLGVSAVWARSFSWLWIVSALVGSAVLLYAAVLLVIDSRLGVRAVDQEMAAIRREAQLEDLHQGIRRLTDAVQAADEAA